MKKFFEFVLLASVILLIAGSSPVGLLLIAASLFMPGMARKRKWYTHIAGVTVTLGNGALGATLQTNDGVCGMVLTGVTEMDGYTLGTPILVTSLAEASSGDNAITFANNPFAYRQISDFYTNAGTGAQLYLMLVADTMTVADMADNTNANGAKKLLYYASGAIKVLGIMSDDTVVTVSTDVGLNGDVYTAVTNMQVMAQAFFTAEHPFRCIIGGTSYDGTVGDLTTMNSGTTKNRSVILLGDIEAPDGYSGGAGACLGFALGLNAILPVQRMMSRVKNGPLAGVNEAYAGIETVEAAGGDMATIAGKGYLTFTTYPNVSGYFFSKAVTCTATTDDYYLLSRGRIIDKAHIIAYTVFVQEVDDEVPVNADGTPDAGFSAYLNSQIVKALNTNMTANKNIDSASCFIDPTQDVLSTGQLNVVLKVTPPGYASDIEITLGF